MTSEGEKIILALTRPKIAHMSDDHLRNSLEASWGYFYQAVMNSDSDSNKTKLENRFSWLREEWERGRDLGKLAFATRGEISIPELGSTGNRGSGSMVGMGDNKRNGDNQMPVNHYVRAGTHFQLYDELVEAALDQLKMGGDTAKAAVYAQLAQAEATMETADGDHRVEISGSLTVDS